MKSSTVLLFAAILMAGCASTSELSSNARDIQSKMSPNKANTVLKKFLAVNNNRDGLCLIGVTPGAVLDYTKTVTVQDSTIHFTGLFGEYKILKSVLQGGTVAGDYNSKKVALDTSDLREIRILESKVDRIKRWCPNVKPGYLVVMKPQKNLVSDAEATVNVSTPGELDELLATLTYLSPNARLVGGTGL